MSLKFTVFFLRASLIQCFVQPSTSIYCCSSFIFCFGLTYAISLCPNKLSEVTKIIVRLGWNWQPIKIVDEFLVHICTVGIHPELDQLFDMVQGNLILFKLKPYNILAKLKKENSK